MNKIKNILSAVLIAAFSWAFTACDSDVDYTPADAMTNAQVYFPKDNSSTLNLSKDKTSFDLDLMRGKTDEALTVNLTAKGGENIFTFPASVSFASGAGKTTITVSYDPEKLVYDEFHNITISISDESLTTPYGVSSYTFKAGIPAPWKSLGKATYVDDLVTTFYKVDNIPYEVEIQENMEEPGIYRLVNPYGVAYPYNEDGDYDADNNYYFEINAQDPEGVYFTQFHSGMDWGNGEFVFWSLADYQMKRQGKTLEEVKAMGLCGTLKDGVITFPSQSLLVGMLEYNNGGLYTSNNNGAFMIAMPGVVLADYSVSVAYLGKYTNADDENFVIGQVNLGKDVASAKVAMVPGEDVNAAIAGMMDGSIETVELTASGTVQMPCTENGTYTLVAISYDVAGEAQELSYETFDVYLGGGSPFDELTQGVSIDDYVGKWLVPAETESASGNMLATLAKADDETLLVTGITGAESGYEDTFALGYDKETGWLIFAPQEVASFQGYPSFIAVTNDEGYFSDAEYLVGGLTQDGKLKFLNAKENEGKWDSFAFLYQAENGFGIFSPTYRLQWTPYVPEAKTRASQFTSFDIQPMRKVTFMKSLKKYIGVPFAE